MKNLALSILMPLLVFAAISWKPVEGEYAIKFSTKRASGTIGGLKGKIDFDTKNIAASKFDVTVDINTLDLGSGLKTKHAKDENFFNAEKYQTIGFKSGEIKKSGDTYVVEGTLTIKATSKKVSIPFTFVENTNSATFKGNFKINRLDYDLQRKGVGEVVDIELLIPVKK